MNLLSGGDTEGYVQAAVRAGELKLSKMFGAERAGRLFFLLLFLNWLPSYVFDVLLEFFDNLIPVLWLKELGSPLERGCLEISLRGLSLEMTTSMTAWVKIRESCFGKSLMLLQTLSSSLAVM
jgi:hypothetical protein